MKIARGTVCDGFRTSPLGTSADSTPRNAKMRTVEARATSPTAGGVVQARFAPLTAKTPTTMSSRSGRSFATVITETKRLAPRIPAMFKPARQIRTTDNTAFRATPVAIAGTSAPSASAKNEETAAVATQMPAHSSTPVRNPTNGPNATSTYAYRPPVSETRLPASAKHSTMRPIATAQTTYAMGAAGPSVAAAPAGSRKIPPPTVRLTMLAARPQIPSARTSECSALARITGLEIVLACDKTRARREAPRGADTRKV